MSATGRQLQRLEGIARMILDARLAELRRASEAREASLRALAAFDRPMPEAAEISPVALAQAAVAYQAWADARRAEINPRLARQTAEWLDRRDAAAKAFGRAEALARVAERLAKR